MFAKSSKANSDLKMSCINPNRAKDALLSLTQQQFAINSGL